MGFVYQIPALVGGTVLIIERVESQNYQPGVAGWALYADGTAEVGDLVARGSLVTGVAPGQRIEIGTPAHPDAIAFYSGDPNEVSPGILESSTPGNSSRLTIESPAQVLNAFAFINLEGFDDGHSVAEIQADNVSVIAEELDLLGNTKTRIGDGNDWLEIVSDPGFTRQVAQVEGETWHALTLQNSWVADAVGREPQYFVDATGMVHVRGVVKNGLTTTIGTLPAGYRPTGQPWDSAALRAGASTAASHVEVSTAGVIVIRTNLATAQTRLELCFSFPTFG